MAAKSIESIVQDMEAGREIHFGDLAKVCDHYFGKPRVSGSHNVYKTPWPLDPRVNIQNDKGKSKRYQVRQVLAAIAKLKAIAEAKPTQGAKAKETTKVKEIAETKKTKK